MDADPADQRRASLRASDADRERFVESLRQHHVDGRLTADELAERTEAGLRRPHPGRPRRRGHRSAPAPAGGPGPRPRPGSRDGRPAAPHAPAGPRQAAAKATLLRTVIWFGTLSLVLIVVWGRRPDRP